MTSIVNDDVPVTTETNHVNTKFNETNTFAKWATTYKQPNDMEYETKIVNSDIPLAVETNHGNMKLKETRKVKQFIC